MKPRHVNVLLLMLNLEARTMSHLVAYKLKRVLSTTYIADAYVIFVKSV